MKFNLIRFFSFSSLIAILIITVVLIFANRKYQNDLRIELTEQKEIFNKINRELIDTQIKNSTSSLIYDYESGNINFARIISNSVWGNYLSPYMNEIKSIDFNDCRRLPSEQKDERNLCFKNDGVKLSKLAHYKSLNDKIFGIMSRTSIFKIKIYDREGITIYSSDPSQLGEDKSENPGWMSALAGIPASKLSRRESFKTFDGTVTDRDLHECYIPVMAPGTNRITAVLEIYSDVTELMARNKKLMDDLNRTATAHNNIIEDHSKEIQADLKNQSHYLIIIITLLMLILSIVLFLIVYHADKHITLQEQEQKRSFEKLIVTENERNKIKEQFYQSEKLATLGTLGAGVAHELRSPLTVILGHAQLLERATDVNIAKIQERAKRIVESVNRMSKIVDRIRQFSRSSELESKVKININQIIEDSFILLSTQLRNRNIEVVKEFGEVSETLLYQIKLESIFQNLIINARDALDEIEKSNKEIRIKTYMEKNFIVVEFSDNGPGIQPENISRITEAFFTTKSLEKGTGLGLSLVKSIIEEHKGTLEIKSSYGAGATFIMRFPIVTEETL